MPNIKSQMKRMRKSEEQRVRNRSVKSSLNTQIKKFEDARDSADAQAASDRYREAARALDRAASKGVIHKKTAARKKSRLYRSMSAAKYPVP